MQIIKDVVSYWGETWQENKFLFFLEFSGTFMGMTAAVLLNLLAPTPPILTIFLLQVVSASFLTYTSYKRRTSFMVILMLFYTVIGIVGISNVLFVGG